MKFEPWMVGVMQECRSLQNGVWGYRFRQATMRKLAAMGLAARRDPDDSRKRPAWKRTAAGERRLAENASEESK